MSLEAKEINILVEGKADKDFLELYLKYLQAVSPDIQIKLKIDVSNGKDGIHNMQQIKKGKWLIIFDADNDIQTSKRDIEKQLDDLEISLDNIKIFLLPNNNDSGNLETLIENIVKYKEILCCFDSYEYCLSKNMIGNKNFRTPAKKTKVFAYMSSFGYKNPTKEDQFDLSPYVNFNSNYLKELKEFLISAFKDNK